MKKLSKFQKILIFTGAAVLLVLICLLLSPEPEPYANITNAQWVQMCQEAYDGLYQKEYLHFTRHTADISSSGNTTASAEIWYSGDNFFQRETLENGDLRAFLMKDGTYYRNRQKELAPAEWNTASGDPIFVRSSGAWSEVDYNLDHFDRYGKQAEVVFSRDGSLPNKDRLRMHYLTFRFDRDLKVTAIVYTYIAYGGDKVDPNDIFLSQTDEYIFYDTPKAEIESVIDAPFQIMEAHRADAEKWTPIAAAAYEDLCSRTFLHYTYTAAQQDEEHAPGYTAQCDGWYSGTDSVTDETRIGQITRTYIRIQKGSVYCKKNDPLRRRFRLGCGRAGAQHARPLSTQMARRYLYLLQCGSCGHRHGPHLLAGHLSPTPRLPNPRHHCDHLPSGQGGPSARHNLSADPGLRRRKLARWRALYPHRIQIPRHHRSAVPKGNRSVLQTSHLW